jgi:succinate dehydrogenase / fumarate reductase cytochrome b subunit
MIVSGLVLLLFVLVHVKQFKYGTWYQTAADTPTRDLYRTEVEVFSQPLWVAFYAICTLVVGLHLRHGIASGLQSLGIEHPAYARPLAAVSLALAILVGGGLAIIPIWVYLTQ